MTTTRREFLHVSASTGALLSLGALGHTRPQEKPESKLKILILGGTGFLGPAIVEAAKPRGHEITLFNRGKTNTQLFPELEKLQGDRDPAKGEGIKSLAGRQWDVVFDDCGYYPRHVKASAELLAPNVKHYVYVSSISCYAKNDVEGIDEDGELAVLKDPKVETMGEKGAYYGGLKVLCEQAAEAALPGRACIVRPGYIVGPGDPTDRFTYWPVRFDQGGEVVVPGAPSDPVQVIDVRDLGEWMVHVAERNVVGRFNACGPEKKLAWGKVIEACVASASNKATPRWASLEVLRKFEKAGFHIWAAYDGETKGFHTVSNARAVAAGLRFRPIEGIVKDTLAWFKTLPPERQARLFKSHDEHYLTPELAAEILAALKA